MEIFIGNLLLTVTVHDLYALLNKYDWAVRVQIFKKSKRGGGVMCYAVAIVESEPAGRAAIAELAGTEVQGQAIAIREFVRRSGGNRRGDMQPHAWSGLERRVADRRSGALVA